MISWMLPMKTSIKPRQVKVPTQMRCNNIWLIFEQSKESTKLKWNKIKRPRRRSSMINRLRKSVNVKRSSKQLRMRKKLLSKKRKGYRERRMKLLVWKLKDWRGSKQRMREFVWLRRRLRLMLVLRNNSWIWKPLRRRPWRLGIIARSRRLKMPNYKRSRKRWRQQ